MSFFNVDTIIVGSAVDMNELALYITECNVKEIPKHGVGDFVTFVPSGVAVEHIGMMNVAPDGTTVLIREHYEVDIHAVKHNGQWYSQSISDRRTNYS